MLRPRTAGRSNAKTGTVPLRGILPLVVLLAIWQIAGGSQPYFPPPSQWYSAIVDLSHSPTFSTAIFATLKSFIFSLVVATIVGAVVGYVVGRSRVVDRMLNPTLEFIRFTPSAAIIPIVVLVAGYVQSMKVIVVVLGAVWPIVLQTRAGTRALNPAILEVAKALRMGPFARARKIIFPLLLPSILLGVRLATSTAIILVLLVEVTTNVDGIGALITTAQTSFMTAEVYGLIVIASLMSLIVNWIIVIAEGYLLRYRSA
jgi:ABC-type nitrate/sulfonate/bicarbonate transport system permease component